ncbi:hypothetical protein LJC74_01560 [Eubacteriales bacterium OttesenSCG-928-A19]|nr:hypothetical protein [Eubacteriales bacterium OttesenSCG-928-A19]
MINDDMIKKLIDVQMENAGIGEDTVVDGRMLKAVLVEVYKSLMTELKG